ncbi:Protein PecM [Paraburkholderia unamae]|uniref:EamA family transporter n=1 Tax=Paraburkholderia unamae TaxID=219649 RepID=UPI001CB1B9FA|nr:EamA family transporter [Paraburkholderia unamae]CAG9268920.1 Protein PecM [Paraburkholderia unamae]
MDTSAASPSSSSPPAWRTCANILATAIAPAIWGSTYIVTTQVLPPDRPFTAALLRALPAGLLLTLYCRRLPRAHEWPRLVALAALNIGFFQACLFVAAYRLPGGLAAVVGALQPLVVMALAWGFDGARPARVAVFAAALGVLGMAALLLSPGATWDAIGVVAALAGALSMACGTWLARRWRPAMPVLAFTGWQLLIGGALLAPAAWWLDPPLPALGAAQIAGYAYLSLAGALLAYALWFRGIAMLSPVAVSSLGLLSPLTAVVLGWVWLGQALRGVSLLGLVTVLGSVLAVQWAMAGPRPISKR